MVNKWRSSGFVAVLIPISSFDTSMGIMEPLPPVGPLTRLHQVRFQPRSHHCLIWKGCICLLVWSSSCRNAVVPLWRIGYDRASDVFIHPQGGNDHGHALLTHCSPDLPSPGLQPSFD